MSRSSHGHTSADAYRLSSSEEDGNIRKNVDNASLSPPRPFFIAGSRGSWSTVTSSNDISDSERERRTPPLSPAPPVPKVVKTKYHHRTKIPKKASSTDSQHSLSPLASPPTSVPDVPQPVPPQPVPTPPVDPFKESSSSSTPVPQSRPPPSSFNFPFQAYSGNPDPIPHTIRKRSSIDSLNFRIRADSIRESYYSTLAYSPPAQSQDFPPYVPYMNGGNGIPSSPPSFNVFRNSVSFTGMQDGSLPRNNSTQSFRAPFLSPASRPSSTVWQPPVYPLYGNNGSPNLSNPSLPIKKSKPPKQSTLLSEKVPEEGKPWLSKKEKYSTLSWWVTVLLWFLGAAGGAALIYFDYIDIHLLEDSQLCLVFEDNFDTLNLNNWARDVELGGFGNEEFQMTTNYDRNSYAQNGQLYIYPTLTSDEIGTDAIFNGGNYTLDGCTTTSSTANSTSCTVSSDSSVHRVINPVQSARLSTRNSYSIRYGKVEVVAKLPRGDWLWPAIWMLPVDNAYGPWPASGEIDIMEARGNSPSYAGQGTNYVRSSLNYGPFESIIAKLYGWQSMKRSSYDQAFHTYTLEWTDSWMRVSVDSRVKATVDFTLSGSGGQSFWERGDFPTTAQNGSSEEVVDQIYSSPSSPFDQSFYLVLDVAAGGTSGWFPDDVGNKPWSDSASSAMYDFAAAQDTWSATWPDNADDRSLRVDSVRMWSLGSC